MPPANIPNRLSTVITADRIVVVEAGQVIESGNCEELMAQNGHPDGINWQYGN